MIKLIEQEWNLEQTKNDTWSKGKNRERYVSSIIRKKASKKEETRDKEIQLHLCAKEKFKEL